MHNISGLMTPSFGCCWGGNFAEHVIWASGLVVSRRRWSKKLERPSHIRAAKSYYLKQGASFSFDDATPSAVIAVQTFGDYQNFNPHLHVIATDGCFYGNGGFTVGPTPRLSDLEGTFRLEVFKMLKKEEKITYSIIENMMGGITVGLTSFVEKGSGRRTASTLTCRVKVLLLIHIMGSFIARDMGIYVHILGFISVFFLSLKIISQLVWSKRLLISIIRF